MRFLPKINQKGISQIIVPLFLIAAVAVAVYLINQQTDIFPSAEESTNAPSGCIKITPVKRLVRYKNCSSASEACNDQTSLKESSQENDEDANYKFDGKVVASYPLKETVWEFSNGWKNYSMKGPRQSDGDRIEISPSRFDSPNEGKSYYVTSDDNISGGSKIIYQNGILVEYGYTKSGDNAQGVSGTAYDSSRSYAFVPSDPSSNVKCDGTSSTGTKDAGQSCSKGSECKSGTCSNEKCSSTGSKVGGDSCSKGSECQSGTCTNNKCEGGNKSNGQSCDSNSDCASNKCSNDKCVAASPSPTGSPKSSSSSNNNGGSGGSGGSGNNGGTNSPNPSASAIPNTSPTATGSATTVPVSLTKAEITGFKNSYDQLYPKLATASGNLSIVKTLANNELTSIVAALPTCPDDANVGKCLDQNFRTRFDLAKTAARLSAFYAIFNGIPGVCVKADIGLNPLITATSQSNTSGRVNLCSDRLVASKVWMIFANNTFTPILSTDTRYPQNPTCASLPPDVLTHYRNAETLFANQSDFIQNTLCDGKTTVAAGGGT